MKNFFTTLFGLITAGFFSQEKKVDSLPLQKEMQEVTITGKKKLIERKVDRTVFNVENSVAAQGGDAIDALKVTPGVKINGDDIKLTGKSSVKVMVNDKIIQLNGEELQNYLKSIPTANIQKIEVITNPPAKYDAEGNSGLINIQLKEVKQDNWSANLRSTYQQGFYARFTEGAGFSYKKDKFSLLADLNYSFGNYLYKNDINYYYPAEHWINKAFNTNIWNNPGLTINTNYGLSDRTTIGLQFIGTARKGTGNESNDNYSYNYVDNSQLKYYKTYGDKESQPKNISLNLNLNHKIDDKGKKFSIDADFFQAKNPRTSSFYSDLNNYSLNTLERQFATNNSSQDIKNYSLKTDWELPYDWANLSFGAKASSTKTNSITDVHFYELPANSIISEQNNHFEYTENNEALYISANKEFGKKWEAKAGLRGEYTQTKAHSVTLNELIKRDYFKIFPTLYLSYKPNEDHTISINYGRRINRAGYQSMDPARWYENPKSYVTGNPFLQPTFVNNLELNYNYKSLLSVNIFANTSKDNITQTTRHNTANESVVTRHENYANGKSFGSMVSVNHKPFKWWESSTDVTAYYGETNPYTDIYLAKKYSGWGATTSTYNTFTINKTKTFLVSLNYWYSFPSKDTGLMDANSSLNIGFRYLAFNKKLTVGLNFNDIFKKEQSIYTEYGQAIKQTFFQYYDSQNIRLSLSYKFGNSKISVNKRESGNEDEKKRAN